MAAFNWTPLEKNTGVNPRQRIRPDSAQNMFYELSHPQRLRQLAISIPAGGALPDLTGLSTKGLTVTSATDRAGSTVVLRLQDIQLTQVFDALTADIVDHVADTTTTEALVETLTRRMTHWIDLFRKLGGTPILSEEQRRGLYGELLTLGQLITVRGAEAVEAWTGPLAANQDFQLDDIAIEVKTTSGSQPQRLLVPNERELDDADVATLILIRIRLDERRDGPGTDLNTAVAGLRARVRHHPGALTALDSRLDSAGYQDQADYDQPRYTVRDITRWRVSGTFPRITGADLRPGVADVSYAIEPSTCAPAEITGPELEVLLDPKEQQAGDDHH